MEPRISAIAIISKDRGLGKNNKLLFHIPGELPRFKKITMGHPVIMGRKTYESIGRPLPGRLNIVVTRDQTFHKDGVKVCNSVEEAIEIAKQFVILSDNKGSHNDNKEIFIIGGGQIYTKALPYTHRLYLTVVDKIVNADTFFPDYAAFSTIISKEKHKDGNMSYTFFTIERPMH